MFSGPARPALLPAACMTKYTWLTHHMQEAKLEGPVPHHSLESFVIGTGFHSHSDFLRAGRLGEALATALPVKGHHSC